MNQLYYFAQAYGECAYGTGAYQENSNCSTATGTQTGTSPNNGVLANTGFAVAVIATLAALLIFLALVVKFWRQKKTAKTKQPLPPNDNRPDGPEQF